MRLISSSWTRALALAAVLLTAACGDRLVAPAAAPPGGPRLDAVATTGFTPLAAPGHGDVSVLAVIDAQGGILDAPRVSGSRYGYTLVVPAGTVSQPTTFTLHVLAGAQYDLELTAQQGEKDVGEKLHKAVTLMVYVGDTPSGHVPRTVKIYCVSPTSEPLAMPSLALPELGYVLGLLPHFSHYSIGAD